MKALMFVYFTALVVLILNGSGVEVGATIGTQNPPVSVCELSKRPSKYASTMVMVDGIIDKTRHGIWLNQKGCRQRLLLTFPNEVNLTPPADFTLEQDSLFEKLQKALYDFKPGTMELKNTIKATLVGRFDSAYVWKDGKRVQLALGFGEHNLAQRRLVIQRITEITVRGDNE